MNRVIFSLFIFLGLACEKNVQPEAVKHMEAAIELEKPDSTFTYLALGDSYTIGESVAQNQRFPVQLSKQLNNENYKMTAATIIAKTGWTTDELKSGINAATLSESYNLVTLLIGVNNQYRGRNSDEYRIQFRELLQTAIGFAENNAKDVIVVSIPDYGVTPFAKNSDTNKIAKEIDTFNQINLEETQKAGARYVNITSISREASSDQTLIAQDGLHPSGKMYGLWVQKILPLAREILQNQN
jgi:lysophospholipase L1-like esterase